MTNLIPAWIVYLIVIIALVFIVTAILQKVVFKVEMQDLPKDLEMEAFKAMNKKKKKLKGLD